MISVSAANETELLLVVPARWAAMLCFWPLAATACWRLRACARLASCSQSEPVLASPSPFRTCRSQLQLELPAIVLRAGFSDSQPLASLGQLASLGPLVSLGPLARLLLLLLQFLAAAASLLLLAVACCCSRAPSNVGERR